MKKVFEISWNETKEHDGVGLSEGSLDSCLFVWFGKKRYSDNNIQVREIKYNTKERLKK